MSKKESNSEYKRKQKFTCSSCFGRRSSSNNFSVIGLSEQNEPYEYVVEKLAIRKVPLSLFATAADLQKHSKTVSESSTPSYVSQKSEKPRPTTEPLREKNSSVTFSAYYQFTPKTDLEKVAKTTPPEKEPSITSLHYDMPEKVVCSPMFQPRPKKVMTEDEEREMVSHILNKHSSLFTLDTKEAIPKDPDHLPKRKAVVPPYVHAVLNNPVQDTFPPIHGRRQIRVDVHRASNSPPQLPLFMPPMKYPATIPPSKKELTPELKQTINALGFAQRPHLPGVPPKNQRSVMGESVCDGITEKELSCNILGGDHVLEGTSSQEMVCHALDLNEKRHLCKPGNKKVKMIIQDPYQDSDYDVCCDGANKNMRDHRDIIPQFRKNLLVEQCSAPLNNKAISTTPNSSHIHILPPRESEGTSEPRLQESEQITEISQLKGQSLKWKIIIKHHSDKSDKEDNIISERNDLSDSDSESKSYLFDDERFSPPR